MNNKELIKNPNIKRCGELKEKYNGYLKIPCNDPSLLRKVYGILAILESIPEDEYINEQDVFLEYEIACSEKEEIDEQDVFLQQSADCEEDQFLGEQQEMYNSIVEKDFFEEWEETKKEKK